MTEHKQKAKEIYWKYYQLVTDCQSPEERAKECAIIAIDEIIEDIIYSIAILKSTNIEFLDHSNNQIKFWRSVKEEIKTL